ncbi:MAG TPA: hypothetical protein VEK08_17340 [Planctomycetota bacterium]|nr:hypothetical protein [Planctomycetota bacterium]
MDRKQWLTMVYREANLFLEANTPEGGELTPTEVNELEPELNNQLQQILGRVDHLEDLIKYSLMRNPPADLWYGEGEWQHVLTAVASACLLHDVKGVVLKILDGSLPRTPSEKLLDPI